MQVVPELEEAPCPSRLLQVQGQAVQNSSDGPQQPERMLMQGGILQQVKCIVVIAHLQKRDYALLLG